MDMLLDHEPTVVGDGLSLDGLRGVAVHLLLPLLLDILLVLPLLFVRFLLLFLVVFPLLLDPRLGGLLLLPLQLSLPLLLLDFHLLLRLCERWLQARRWGRQGPLQPRRAPGGRNVGDTPAEGAVHVAAKALEQLLRRDGLGPRHGGFGCLGRLAPACMLHQTRTAPLPPVLWLRRRRSRCVSLLRALIHRLGRLTSCSI
mmetsp:Transcript_25872/g.65260  ORF Transcript_25872/g.65260 Transcript_25872/m.65260 type:complete len:200 (+) Transcript_25872:963-1562(+)